MAYLVVGSNVNITLECDEVNSSLPLKKGNNTYYVGYADEKNFYTGNYDKGPVPTLHYNNNNWISFHIGEVDQTQTAAPIRYNVSLNNTTSDRNIELTVEGITNRKFSITLKMQNLLMYMIKDTNSSYGSVFECIKINNEALKLSTEQPLTSTTDISIYNGKTNGNYNNIVIQVLPYRNKDISFGLSQFSFVEDPTLDKLIKSSYTLETIKDSSFLGINYNSASGILNVSTNKQNSWNPLNDLIGVGDIVDVSSHYRFNPNSGTNLPSVDLFISNLLRYRVILSFNLKITCVSTGVCFFNTVLIDGITNSSVSWPLQANQSITMLNFSPNSNRLLIDYPNSDITINQNLFNLCYTISIQGYTYRDYDGRTTTSNGTLNVKIANTTNSSIILSIQRNYSEHGGIETMHINFVADKNKNNLVFIRANDWPLNWGDWLRDWEPDPFLQMAGIQIEVQSNLYRFESTNTISRITSIPVLKLGNMY